MALKVVIMDITEWKDKRGKTHKEYNFGRLDTTGNNYRAVKR